MQDLCHNAALPILTPMDQGSIANLRKSYERAELDENASHALPLQQFDQWLQEAINAAVPEPNAMTLATMACLRQKVSNWRVRFAARSAAIDTCSTDSPILGGRPSTFRNRPACP